VDLAVALTVAVADLDVGPRPVFEHVGKILGRHDEPAFAIYIVAADQFSCHIRYKACLRRVVDQRREYDAEIEFSRGPEPARNTASDASHVLLYQSHRLGAEAASGAANHSRFGDDIIGLAGVDLSDAEDRGIDRREIARHDRLQGDRDMAGSDDGVDPGLGTGAMCAAAGDGDVEIDPARHHRPGANLELADRQSRPVVHAKDCVAREAVEQTVGDHRRAAAKTFFGRLKDQMHGAVEIAGLGKVPSRTEQHRRMPVMAAGMHAPVISRSVGKVGRLLNRQAVHIGSKPNRAQRIASAQPANDTGLTDAAKYLAAEPGELLGDEVGGALLFEPEFGMGMNVMPPFLQFVMEFRDAFDDLHAASRCTFAALLLKGWFLAIRRVRSQCKSLSP